MIPSKNPGGWGFPHIIRVSVHQ